MWQAEFKLYLYPDDPTLLVSKSNLKSILSNCEFIGKKQAEKRFQTGDNFLSLISFMGCSPNIELEPQDGKPYCYIEIGTTEKMQFISGKNTRNLVCPECKTVLKNINERLLQNTNKNKYNCPECQQHSFIITTINWRKTAFSARCWIMIGNIYESEAVPNEQLLISLKNSTGVEWKYAYIRKKP